MIEYMQSESDKEITQFWIDRCLRLEAENSAMRQTMERLAILAKRTHTYCEDGWYSCPKAEDGCYNDARGPECDCGADEHNAEVDALMRSNLKLRGGLSI